MEEPVDKKRRVMYPSPSVKSPDQIITVKRRSISNEEERLYEEADIKSRALLRELRKVITLFKNVSEKVQDGNTAEALQGCIDGHDLFVEARQSLIASRKRFGEIRLDDFIHVDLITLTLLQFLPLKDIFNLRLSSKLMYEHVTRLCPELNVWKIDLNLFKKSPPQFFFSSDIDIKVTLPCTVLTSVQREILIKCANRIIVLDGSANLHGYQALQDVPEDACTNMSRLQSLTVGQTRYQSRKNVVILLNQHGDSLQELCLERFDARNLTKVDPECKFNNLTKLHLEACKSNERARRENDWPRIASFINNCPNLVDLQLKCFPITEETIVTHTKLKYLDLFMFFEPPVAANVINLMMACRDSLEYLKISALQVSTIFERDDWFLPRMKRVRIKGSVSPEVMENMKKHFNDNAKIKVKNVQNLREFFEP